MAHKISTNIGKKPDLAFVPIDRINVDRNYQRDLKTSRVQQILKDFNWSQFQPVMLARKPDGTFNVYDGQHRVAAARLHPQVEEVPAAIIDLADLAGEAGAFVGVNTNRTAVTSIEKYWAGIEAGDENMIRIRSVLDRAGCEIVQAAGCFKPNATNAVSMVGRAIKNYGDSAVILACTAIRRAWPADNQALKGITVTALARVFKLNPKINHSRVDEILGAIDRTKLAADAEAMRGISGGDAATAVANTIAALYNRGRAHGKITANRD